MPLDSAEATGKTFIFDEIVKEYPNDTWQIGKYTFQDPRPEFLRAIPPFTKCIRVILRATGGGFFDVVLETEETGNPNDSTCIVGNIRKG
jgi:hypothetical protein